MGGEEPLIITAGILHAAIRVMDEAGGRLPPSKREMERVTRPGGLRRTARMTRRE
jgi:hypothetical protein